MAGLERGRSPSAGQQHHIRHSSHSSASGLPNGSYTGLDNNLALNQYNPLNAQATSGAFSDPSFTQDYAQQTKWSLASTYADYGQQEQLQQPPIVPSQRGDIANQYLPSVGRSSLDHGQGNYGQGSNHVSPSALSQDTSPSNTESSAFPSFDFNQTSFDLGQTNFDTGASLDPSLLAGLGSNSSDLLASQQDLSNHNLSHDQMASTMQSHAPTPPHLMPEMARRQSNSPSPHATPSFPQSGFQTMNRPRNLSESLDPSSAMFPQQSQNEWGHMGAYRTHRRTPSDQYSDFSSHSNQASPYTAALDSFDNGHSSPLLNPSQDPTFNGDLGLQSFNLNENQIPPLQSYISPGHSPSHSPRLVPQQQLPPFTAENNYGLLAHTNGQYMQPQQNGLEMFPGQGQEAFPSLNHTSPGDLGAADQMSPPEINIDYAPPSKPVENMRPHECGGHTEPTSTE